MPGRNGTCAMRYPLCAILFVFLLPLFALEATLAGKAGFAVEEGKSGQMRTRNAASVTRTVLR